MRRLFTAVWLAVLSTHTIPGLYAQSEVDLVQPILREEILPPAAALFLLKHHIVRNLPAQPAPQDPEQWTAGSKKLRESLLREVVFHGWPAEWVNAAPRFEDAGLIESGSGYRMRKLRYEIVPGFWSAAILYEPEQMMAGKLPAILNVNGHVGPVGKAVEYKQKRCINFAKRGMLALNLEWLAFGELNQKENRHWFGAHLDLVGANGLGLFYLAMRKGLDYLWEHPNTDRARVGMTGLSGGGWQTIVLSSLDERVAAAVPVAGFAATRTRVEARDYGDLGDIEQNATDFIRTIDYPHLVALRAPRRTLLAYNAEDDCCFRAPMAKPYIYDALRPVFGLYGRADALEWHENNDPGTHNYQLDNRIAAYRFFARHFGLPPVEGEIPVDAEIKSPDELAAGLPKDNLTILGLARRMASASPPIPLPPSDTPARQEWARAGREKLRETVRFKPAGISSAWNVMNSKNKGVETLSYNFLMADGLPATGVLLRSITAAPAGSATIVLHDKGRGEAASIICDRVNRGEQVLAADLLFIGDAWKGIDPASYVQILHGMGMRVVGMQAAQLHALSRWLRESAGGGRIRLEACGMRSQAAARIAAALEPELYREVVVRDGIASLGHLLDKPVEYADAPELFCLDLYRHFDLDRIAALGP
jgi:dienelactone hydrolase